MKELSIEEKAKRYDEIIEKANKMHSENCEACQMCIEELIPELKESEDEKHRKWILEYLYDGLRKSDEQFKGQFKCAIAWLEKQVSQDNVEDVDILHRFSFYLYKDEPNVLYLSGVYVNEEYRNKGIGTKILEVADEVAKSLNCHAIRLKTKRGSNAERLYQTHGYNSLVIEGRDEIWLEKQGEPTIINPSEFDSRLNKLLKQFETLPKEELESSLAFYLNVVQKEKQGEQKPADKVEPKFKVGDWLVENEPNNYARFVQILEVVDVQGKERYRISRDIHKDEDVVEFGFIEKYYHNFDIQDAKDGDVLFVKPTENLGKQFIIFGGIDSNSRIKYYCRFLNNKFSINDGLMGYDHKYFLPSTKEQRDTLEKAMADAGWEFDFNKKELKKIEQNLIDNYCKEHCKGYQETGKCFADGECDTKRESEQKPAWSEEDEEQLGRALYMMEQLDMTKSWDDVYNWLKSLKDKVLLQPKQEWSRYDETILKNLIDHFEYKKEFNEAEDYDIVLWLKSLKERCTWKPSDEHYELEEFAKIVRGNLTGISKAVQKLFEAKYLQLTGNKMYGGFKD